VFELQGNVFFADAEQLIRRVLDGLGPARIVVLDGHRLGRIDPPAINLLVELANGIAGSGRVLVTAGFPIEDRSTVDLGAAMAAACADPLEGWEEAVLAPAVAADRRTELPLSSQELLRGITSDQLAAVGADVEILELPIGAVLAHEGDAADSVYFLLSG